MSNQDRDTCTRAFHIHWRALTAKGDPLRRTSPYADDFAAGWQAALSAGQATEPAGENIELLRLAAKKTRDWLGANCVGEPPRPHIALLSALAESVGAAGLVIPEPPTDEQLHTAFDLDSGGPNPYYRCKSCGTTGPGLREYLVAHYLKCAGAAPTLGDQG